MMLDFVLPTHLYCGFGGYTAQRYVFVAPVVNRHLDALHSGLQVLQDQYMAVKLRHMPSAEVLSPLVNVLSKEHWPPGSDFTMHVLVHLLRNYMSTTKQYVALL